MTEPNTPNAFASFVQQHLVRDHTWLVTGCAGFIGSHLAQALLGAHQHVIGIDDLSSGRQANLEAVKKALSPQQWQRMRFVQADITDAARCRKLMQGVDYVLHHAAIASVPHSLLHPRRVHEVNVNGTLNLLLAAREAGVQRFIYASSSAVYGNQSSVPHVETGAAHCLSPYALSKLCNEQYAALFQSVYDVTCIGLRYFNIFGPRQCVNSQYGAVIPTWLAALRQHQTITVHGDGQTTRDFCFIDDVIQANLRAALAPLPGADAPAVYNIARGEQTTLNGLLSIMREVLVEAGEASRSEVVSKSPRSGDIRHSFADITAAQCFLGFCPNVGVREGLKRIIGNDAMTNESSQA